MTSTSSSDADAAAPAQALPLRVRLRPVSGAQIVGWLLHVDQLGERRRIRLESFDDDTAIVSVDPPALGVLIPLLSAGQPPPAVELLSAPTPRTTGTATVSQTGRASPARAVRAGHARRMLGIAALIVAIALAVAAGFAAGRLIGDEADGNTPAAPPLADMVATVAPITTSATTSAVPLRARVARDLTGACIPVPDASQCDAVRAALWSGDAAAWRDWATRRGEPPPAAVEIAARAIGLRLAAADPAARIDFARATGAPLPLIAALHLQWQDDRIALLAVEIANLGARPIDLSGAFVPGLGIITRTTLAPGERCALGAGAAGPRCAGGTSAAPPELTAGERVRLLRADGQELDQMSVP